MSDGDHDTAALPLDEVIEIINAVESEVSDEDWMGASREQILEGLCNRVRGRVRSRSLSKARRSADTEGDR